MISQPILLSIIELGGYPNFTPLYESVGYRVETVTSVRKALSFIKKTTPDVVIAEFNFQSDFRDRTSSLETLMAVLEQKIPKARVVVFYESGFSHQFDKLRANYSFYRELSFPIDEKALAACLSSPDDA
ncbi:MAG TPA: hypothetical protein ENG78_07905 [Acidiferrobacteraceae bacterium]|nr:hypothetical protein [Acidiferrobacteraceae bacterium]HEX20725.1 hypothetical protein [Acidiferrobacteraceae bacterium]